MKLVRCIFLVSHVATVVSAFLSHPVCHRKNEIIPFLMSSSSSSLSSSSRLLVTPEPLAEEGSWQAFLDDETTGLIYYFDTKTGESLWEPPTSTFPAVRLPRKKQRLAEELRRNYRKARQQETEKGGDSSSSSSAVQVMQDTKAGDDSGSGLPSWIEGLVEVKGEKAAPVVNQVEEPPSSTKQEKKGFFSGFFGDKGVTAVVETEKEPVEEERPESANGESVAEVTVKKEKGGLFAALEGLKGVASSVIELQESTDVVETAKPTVKKQKQQQQVEKKKEPAIIDTSPQPIKIEVGSYILPHPSKVRWGGEDALFVKGRTFGVFDGVSGAEKLDGVPLYSRTLAEEMKKSLTKDSITIQEITKLLTDAADFADDSATGASTAVVASIGENGFLQALNVGDSLCMVVRDGKIAAKTREISHYWECPYQLSGDCPDRPRDGTKLNVELIPGDLIIMGSDGIFDNVGDDMLLDLITKSSRVTPTQLAKKICDLSRKQSLDRQSVTPYGKQAQRRGDPAYKDGLGGKVDDASCIVVVCK